MKDQLSDDLAAAIGDELAAQCRQCFDKVVETDWRLTQHNFLMNAGGVAALLAYIGSNPNATFAIWPLICFLVGIIASGVEIRALLKTYSALHSDALRRREGFMMNRLSVADSVPKEGVAGKAAVINHWSGVISQTAFVLGVVWGVVMYLYAAP